MIFTVVADVLEAYLVLLFVRVILSWIPVDPWSKFAPAVRWIHRVTDPVLVPVRRLIPPLRLGGGAIDLSPLVVLIVLQVVIQVVRAG